MSIGSRAPLREIFFGWNFTSELNAKTSEIKETGRVETWKELAGKTEE